MGLDIRYYGHLEPCPTPPDEENYPDYMLKIYEQTEWPTHLTPLKPGWHSKGGYHSEGRFRAGSYSGYSRWREQLSQAIHGVEPRTIWQERHWENKPFFGIIHFTDCDGVIGASMSGVLANEFKEHRHFFAAHVPDDYALHIYDDFAHAFAVAARSGAVIFT